MYKMILPIILYSMSIHGALVSRIAILHTPTLTSLSPSLGIATQRRTLTEQDEVLLTGFKSLLTSDRFYASKALSSAMAERDIAFIESMLHIGVTPRHSHIDQAAFADDHELVNLLLPKIREPKKFPDDAHCLSLAMIRCFFAHGAKVSSSHGCYSPTGLLVNTLRHQSIQCSRSSNTAFSLDHSEKRHLLEKVILFIEAEDPLKFSVMNQMSYAKSMEKYRSWPSFIDCYDAEGDWTVGAFPELTDYIRAVLVCRKDNVDIAGKNEAQKKIAEILTQYGISEEEVIAKIIPLPEESRIQEA